MAGNEGKHRRILPPKHRIDKIKIYHMLLNRLTQKAVVFCTGILLSSLLFTSCQKELSGEGFIITETPPDLTTKVNASVSGFVTDENDAPVNGASVQVGLSSTSTDKYGYFEVSNAQVTQNAALVTVLKPGYFKGIKTFIAATGKSAFFRIKLLPKNSAGTFDAAAGGTVSLPNGLSVSFPANAVVTEAGGTAYTGAVNVAAQWINPVATDLHRIMPGDLRGLDSLGFIRQLTTYGMAAVELTGTGGELLQVAPGKKATLSFPIPSSIIGSAPASIPLWSFDEAKGLWKQEGHANKSGSNYVGEVSHFSFWNCDVPANFVQFSCTLYDAAGNPVPHVLVKLSRVDNPQSAAWGYTDSAGYTGGAVPKNAQLLLEVFTQYGCGSAVFSQTITTTDQNLNLGVLTIPSTSTATVSGTVTNCSASPVTSGFVIMLKDNFSYRYPVTNGSFSFTTTLCNNTPVQVQLIAEDLDNLQAGNPQTLTLNTGANAAGNLSACGITIEQFIEYSINGTSYSFVYPNDSLMQYVNDVQVVPPLMYINANTTVNTGGTLSRYASIAMVLTGIGQGSVQPLQNFICTEIRDSTSITSPISVNITEYGSVGQYIAGNFSGTFTGAAPASTAYNVVCNFRVRRRQ